jgi:hypothetical protein
MSVKCQKRNMLQFDMINRKLKKTEGAINSGQSRDTCNSGHMTENEDENKHTTMKTKKRSNKLSLCKGKYHFTCTDEIFSRMWQPFIQIKGNYDKILPLASLKHNLVTLKNNMNSYKQPRMRQTSVSSTLREVT